MTTFLTTMKKTTLGFVLLFLLCQIFNAENLNAQTAPPGIPYQAIARNANGTPYVNSSLSVRFSLHEQTATGTVSYAESHSLQTNDLGLFSTTFGSGTPITGAFAAINWAQTTKFLQVEINLGSAWVDMGTQQLMSVPYAMYAANSQPGPQGPAGPAGNQGSTGADGTGITNTQILNDSLIVTYNNSQTQNAGKVKTTYIAGNGISISGDTISSSSNSLSNAPNLTGRTNIGFASSGTWTCPAGVTQIIVQLWGAGGGGGSGSAGYTTGSGPVGCVQICGSIGSLPYGGNGGVGGNGGYLRDFVSVVPGQTYSIIVGIGGAGGNSPSCNTISFNPGNIGTAGGLTSFGGLLSAPGGTGGQGGTSFLGGCQNGASGSNGSISNYSSNETSIVIQSQSSPISYVPSGYLTSIITPGNQAGGGGGGIGGRVNQCPQGFCPERCFCPPPGGIGQNGFCIISY
jgi:hypothetical protein